MPITASVFVQHKLRKAQGVSAVDFDDGTLKLMLLTSAYTPDIENHDFLNDASANEVTTGTSYSAGGPALANKALNAPGDTYVYLDADNIVIAQDATGFANARYGVVYQDTGDAATSELIVLIDLGSDRSVQDGAITLNLNASGLIRW